MYAKILPVLVLFIVLVVTPLHARRHIVGAWSDADIEDEYVRRAADFAVDEIEEVSNSHYEMGVEKIISARKQVVGGMNYNIMMIVHQTDCEKDGHFGVAIDSDSDDAPDKTKRTHCKKTGFQDCNVKVYERPWENYMRVTSLSCEPSTTYQGPQKRRAGKLSKLFGGRRHH